jgi:fructokinase
MIARPIVLGEVLFDCFPDGSAVLGGAPFNVYAHLGRMGLEPMMISRIGDDSRGRQLLEAMESRDLLTEGIQTDPHRSTGEVIVTVSDDGHPQFDIPLEQAWDAVNAVKTLVTMESAKPSMIYCGTLAMRSEATREAYIMAIEQSGAPLFLDVNLRDPWWQRPLVDKLIKKASWVKCNQQEAEILFGIKDRQDARSMLPGLCERLGLKLLILTLSERGAMVTDGYNLWQAAPPESDKPFLDSVGAGDACACGFIEGIHKHYEPDTSLRNALQLASDICRVRGGVFPV